jgi:hypothetical protein
MANYEIRLYRPQNECSAWYFVQCASDRHALAAARRILSDTIPSASVWQEERRVGDLAQSPADMPMRFLKAAATG